mmetsp:Transcript_13014/g.28947  ORF Transcript_13014/g.28947 Transcript_13014/m.28947 type:complete len:285 (-) Transcript_13014:1085-1939(-)
MDTRFRDGRHTPHNLPHLAVVHQELASGHSCAEGRCDAARGDTLAGHAAPSHTSSCDTSSRDGDPSDGFARNTLACNALRVVASGLGEGACVGLGLFLCKQLRVRFQGLSCEAGLSASARLASLFRRSGCSLQSIALNGLASILHFSSCSLASSLRLVVLCRSSLLWGRNRDLRLFLHLSWCCCHLLRTIRVDHLGHLLGCGRSCGLICFDYKYRRLLNGRFVDLHGLSRWSSCCLFWGGSSSSSSRRRDLVLAGCLCLSRRTGLHHRRSCPTSGSLLCVLLFR